MLNFVIPCKAPLEPLPTTTPDISYESQPKDPIWSFPGYLIPCFKKTLFCKFLFGVQVTKNLPLLLGLKITLVSLTPFSHWKDPFVVCCPKIKESL